MGRKERIMCIAIGTIIFLTIMRKEYAIWCIAGMVIIMEYWKRR